MELSSRFSEALVLAAELHRDQVLAGKGVPYMAHLLGTTSIALEYGANEDEAIAALLHDAIEDQGGAAVGEEIRRRFGDHVAAIVIGCTDSDQTPKPPWRARKEAYVSHLRQADRSVLLVAGSDKLYNSRATLADYRRVGEDIWSWFSGGREGTLWYRRGLVGAFQDNLACPAGLADELDRVVSQLESLAAGGDPGR